MAVETTSLLPHHPSTSLPPTPCPTHTGVPCLPSPSPTITGTPSPVCHRHRQPANRYASQPARPPAVPRPQPHRHTGTPARPRRGECSFVKKVGFEGGVEPDPSVLGAAGHMDPFLTVSLQDLPKNRVSTSWSVFEICFSPRVRVRFLENKVCDLDA